MRDDSKRLHEWQRCESARVREQPKNQPHDAALIISQRIAVDEDETDGHATGAVERLLDGRDQRRAVFDDQREEHLDGDVAHVDAFVNLPGINEEGVAGFVDG
jgi:hypothetical protein